MELEFTMQDELYNSDFCFPRYDLYDREKNYDYSQKFYAFDCNIGTFCCYANNENILKIIEVNLEDLFLNKSFNKQKLLDFKSNTVRVIRIIDEIPENYPVVFWFYRGYDVLGVNEVLLKDYLSL